MRLRSGKGVSCGWREFGIAELMMMELGLEFGVEFGFGRRSREERW